jgi:hypothetical protein
VAGELPAEAVERSFDQISHFQLPVVLRRELDPSAPCITI